MIPLESFLACIQENAARAHAYESGHDGSDGKCDCIGLIIGALALAGFRWPGTHGSNWAARNAMTTPPGLCPTSPDRGGVFLGEIVYKAKEPGESGYSLPERYRNSGDLRDYYHVGVVTSVEPLIITHCTNVPGGIKEDRAITNWRWGGKLKYVNNGKGEGQMEPVYQAKAHAEGNDYPVKMRTQPNANADVLAKIPQGEIVDVISDGGKWSFILYGDQTGYMMNKFLIPVKDDEGDKDEEMAAVSCETLETWANALEEMARDMRERLGRG